MIFFNNKFSVCSTLELMLLRPLVIVIHHTTSSHVRVLLLLLLQLLHLGTVRLVIILLVVSYPGVTSSATHHQVVFFLELFLFLHFHVARDLYVWVNLTIVEGTWIWTSFKTFSDWSGTQATQSSMFFLLIVNPIFLNTFWFKVFQL